MQYFEPDNAQNCRELATICGAISVKHGFCTICDGYWMPAPFVPLPLLRALPTFVGNLFYRCRPDEGGSIYGAALA